MIRAFRSEWLKLGRWPTLIGAGGTVVAFGVLVTSVMFLNATVTAVAPVPGGGPRGGEGFPTFARLQASDGFLVPLANAGQFIGIISLVFFAGEFAAEYTNATLKMAFVREPRRLVFLAGKFAALSLLIALAVVAAVIVVVPLAWALAAYRGIDTSAWWSLGGATAALHTTLRFAAAAIAQGLLGMMLALVFRAAPAAIGIGMAYTIAVEPIITLVWNDGRQWLPGAAISAFAAGGTVTLDFARAAWLVLAYAIAFAIVSGALIERRDVTG
ncbi:MAG: hypothetical protein ACYDCK_10475 [Thermoplasmatota archaeon]